ncbi:tereporin-Ca1-like [Ylistrum balloti]|uniref:tereporin-Ca1-like n=1 Tax=Ylistrum balloti TaxID=509963 RepID=UPI00290587B4|nr:tereporin-Ca1-like [Ylistrum balloti]
MFAGLVAAVSAGSSLAGTTVSALTSSGGYSVACGIETANWTKYTLEKPMAFNDGGLIKTPPIDILPGVKEAMITHKTGGTATGTYGSVSWVVNDRRVVVMWSVPFNHDYYQNWLGVGLTKPGKTKHDKSWYKTMYYQSNTSELSFIRKKFYTDVNPVTISDEDFEVEGTIGSTHIADAHIVVRPRNEKDYAPSLLKVWESSKA